MDVITELTHLAERQHGVVAGWQLPMERRVRSVLARCRAGPAWEPLSPRVLRRRGAPRSRLQRAMAAVLDVGPGGVLSHSSAAALWGLPGFSLEPCHVVLPRRNRRTRTRLATVHRCAALPSKHLTAFAGVPVVRPEFLVLQLCGASHPSRAERAFENAWSMRLLSGDSVRRTLDATAASGRAGVQLLRALLDARGPGYVPPASGLEVRFVQLLRERGLPTMRRQVDLGDETWTGRVDFVADDVPLVVEINSERYHSALLDRDADARRYEKLEAAGFVVRAVTDLQVWHRPGEVVALVREGRRAAISRISGATDVGERHDWRQESKRS